MTHTRTLLDPSLRKLTSSLSILIACLVILMAGWAALPPHARAENPNQSDELAGKKKDLTEVDQAIQTLQKELKKIQIDKSKQVKALKESELIISRTAQRLKHLDEEIKTSETSLDELEVQQAEQRQALSENKDGIRAMMQSSYRAQRQPDIKLWLNTEDPYSLARLLTYSRYLTKAQQQQAETFINDLETLAEQSQAIEAQTAQIRQLKDSAAAEQAAQVQAQSKRKQILASLNKELKAGDKQMQQLQENRSQLTAVVKQIEKAIALMNQAKAQKPFDSLQSQLPWPVKGKLRDQFGSRINNSSLKRDGVFIATEENAPVNAVQDGRVVFADWLRGFGLLIILDHGNQYLTLYGQNHSLLKETGNWVRKGEQIALTGTSGGAEESGLYFEVRHKGEPQNPANWLSQQR